MTRALFSVIFLLAFSGSLFAQKMADKYRMSFVLDGDPSLSEVRLDNPKASWKVKFWLRVVDSDSLSRGAIDVNDKEKVAKYYKKKFKHSRKGIFITKGEFKKMNLSDVANRSMEYQAVIPVKAFETIPKEKKIYFIFTTKTEVKIPGLKKKIKRNLEYPLDLESIPNDSFELQFKIVKTENGDYTTWHHVDLAAN